MNRPICSNYDCTNSAKQHGFSVKGHRYYSKYCSLCEKKIYGGKGRLEKYKKGHCEKCGFQPENLCQLDVDHIDGDNNNNDPTNYQTLCANCHRLKTYLNKEWKK